MDEIDSSRFKTITGTARIDVLGQSPGEECMEGWIHSVHSMRGIMNPVCPGDPRDTNGSRV